jgi:hypothetical protein
MAHDDRRMHEGRSRSGDERHRGHEHHEDARSENDRIGAGDDTPQDGAVDDIRDVDSTTDRDQDSALGGHVGTRSSGA